MVEEYNHLNHSTWDCKYHVVFMSDVRPVAGLDRLTMRPWAVTMISVLIRCPSFFRSTSSVACGSGAGSAARCSR